MKKRELLEPLGLTRTVPRHKILLKECKTYRRMKRFIHIHSYLYLLMPSYTCTYFKSSSSLMLRPHPLHRRACSLLILGKMANNGTTWPTLLSRPSMCSYSNWLGQLATAVHTVPELMNLLSVVQAVKVCACAHVILVFTIPIVININRLCIHVPLYTHGVTKTTLHFTLLVPVSFPGFLWCWFTQEHMNRMKWTVWNAWIYTHKLGMTPNTALPV